MPEINEKHTSEHLKPKPSLFIDVTTGLGTGAFCAGAFNPWDLALYRSLSQNKPFFKVTKDMLQEALNNRSFINPMYRGCGQAVAQRAFSWGAYYILQNQGKASIYPFLREQGFSEAQAQFAVGTFAGSMSGAITNPLSTTKYHLWKHPGNTFASSAKDMWQQGEGLRPFLKGAVTTIKRDTVFGSTYEVLRTLGAEQLKEQDQLNEKTKFIANMMAAGAGTIASAPLNYARTMQYDAPPHQKPPATSEVLKALWSEVSNKSTFFEGAKHLQQRLRIGPGTARVMVGMAVGQSLFNHTNDMLNEQFKPKR